MSTAVHFEGRWRAKPACGAGAMQAHWRREPVMTVSRDIMRVTCGTCLNTTQYRRASMMPIPREHPVRVSS